MNSNYLGECFAPPDNENLYRIMLYKKGMSMHDIMHNTDLINPYAPNYKSGYVASLADIKYLEKRNVVGR